MHGGRQQYIDLTLEKNKINIRVEKSMYNYSKKIYKVSKKEEEKHRKLLQFINNY